MSNKQFFTLEADVNCASSGDNTLIAARSDRKIYIWKLWLVANGSVNVKFRSGTTDLNGFAIPLTSQGSNLTFAFDGEPYWTTDLGALFAINLSGAVQVTGRIYYTYE
jgi:hypothetical protein